MAKNKKRDFKAMFAQHVEKGVLGLAVVGMVYFAMTSFKKGIDDSQTPAEINNLVKNAESHMNKTNTIAGTPAADAFKTAKYNVVMEHIATAPGFPPLAVSDPAIWAHVDQRQMPTFFAVEDLRVNSIVAAIVLNSEQATANAKFNQARTQAEKLADEEKKRQAAMLREQARQGKGGKGRASEGDGGTRPPPGGKGRPDPLGIGPGPRNPAGPLSPAEIPEPPNPNEKMIGNVKVEIVNMGIITGLIPYKKLYDSYFNALIKDKMNDTNHSALHDEPIFTDVLVERAEVTDPNVPADKLTWVNLSKPLADWYRARGDQLEFDESGTIVPTVCDPGEVASGIPGKPIPERPLFVMTPMPRLANQVWGRNALHPRIPLAADVNKAEQEKSQSQVNLGTNAAPKNILTFGAPGQQGMAPPPAMTANQQPVEPEEVLEYMMFRCIDPYQEQGRKYRYRVTLTYLNPNYNVDKKSVEDPQTTVNPEVVGPISEASPISTPPLDEKIIVTKVAPARRPGDSPKVDEFWYWKAGYTGTYDKRAVADASALALDSAGRTGGEVAKEFPGLSFGDVFAHVDKIPALYNHLTSSSEEIDKHHFNLTQVDLNRAYLVDVHGGDKTPKTAVEEQPELIYADANGNLHWSRAMNGQITVDNYKKRYAKTDGTTASPGTGGGRSRMNEDDDPLLRGRGGR